MSNYRRIKKLQQQIQNGDAIMNPNLKLHNRLTDTLLSCRRIAVEKGVTVVHKHTDGLVYAVYPDGEMENFGNPAYMVPDGSQTEETKQDQKRDGFLNHVKGRVPHLLDKIKILQFMEKIL